MTNTLTDPRVVTSSGGGMCPEQHFGELTDGSVFYFRLRWGWAELKVGAPGTEISELPLTTPGWSYEEANAAYEAGEEYPPLFAGPIGEVQALPDDPYAGFFNEDTQRDLAFTQCLDQIWRDGRVVYGGRESAT